MSCATVAERAGLSLRTVQRVLGGCENSDPSFFTILAIAEALDLRFVVEGTPDLETRRAQAEYKADQLVSMVQGTSALEAQGISVAQRGELRERTIHELLAGSNRRLWSR